MSRSQHEALDTIRAKIKSRKSLQPLQEKRLESDTSPPLSTTDASSNPDDYEFGLCTGEDCYIWVEPASMA